MPHRESTHWVVICPKGNPHIELLYAPQEAHTVSCYMHHRKPTQWVVIFTTGWLLYSPQWVFICTTRSPHAHSKLLYAPQEAHTVGYYVCTTGSPQGELFYAGKAVLTYKYGCHCQLFVLWTSKVTDPSYNLKLRTQAGIRKVREQAARPKTSSPRSMSHSAYSSGLRKGRWGIIEYNIWVEVYEVKLSLITWTCNEEMIFSIFVAT